ncbi:hypothetical protein CHS0354_001444 [Potamilus streckersoni]|uniref:Uncharacterized protein n=1 Tax=Potamilus streckersoni TaxID=2493646 RepID=A0AAE0T8U6_9BIVA|nr:hypothetical protein CHS0354_001444 [Potamilus streckersoni]
MARSMSQMDYDGQENIVLLQRNEQPHSPWDGTIGGAQAAMHDLGHNCNEQSIKNTYSMKRCFRISFSSSPTLDQPMRNRSMLVMDCGSNPIYSCVNGSKFDMF